MMPFSYQGFGFTSIVLMLMVLIASQLFRHLKEWFHKKKVRSNSVGK